MLQEKPIYQDLSPIVAKTSPYTESQRVNYPTITQSECLNSKPQIIVNIEHNNNVRQKKLYSSKHLNSCYDTEGGLIPTNEQYIETTTQIKSDIINDENYYIESIEEQNTNKPKTTFTSWLKAKWSNIHFKKPEKFRYIPNPIIKFKEWKRNKKEKTPQNEEMWTDIDKITPITNLIPAFNPEINNNEDTILDLIKQCTPMQELLRKGFNIKMMKEECVDFDILKKYGYTIYDISSLIQNYDDLIVSGFNKYHLGGRWNVKQISEAYDIELGSICVQMDFKANDFPLNNISIYDMKNMCINIDILIETLNIEFDTLYAWNIDFTTFADTFHVTEKHIGKLKLNKIQQSAMSTVRNWSAVEIASYFKVPIKEIRKNWVCIELPKDFQY